MGAQSAAIDCILGQGSQVWIPHGSPPLASVLADADIAPEPFSARCDELVVRSSCAVGQFFKLAMAVLFSPSLRASAAILLRAPITQRFLSFLSA